jgi:hypothetical protein
MPCEQVCATESKLDLNRQFASVGNVASFAEYLIMDSAGNPVADRYERGELWIAGAGEHTHQSTLDGSNPSSMKESNNMKGS